MSLETCDPPFSVAYFESLNHSFFDGHALPSEGTLLLRRLFGVPRVMQIWPAIDLRGGRCVRLQQGDYGRETVFGEDPAAMARHWAREGADRLHLVDLDGARDGKAGNRESIEAIVHEIGRAHV